MHRGWRDCEAFEDRRDPMADADAWFWIIEHTAWKPLRRTAGQGQSVMLKRGQIHISDRSLATAFHWDKKRVRRFLERLEQHGMVLQNRDQSGTILTVCNYDKYQQISEPSGPAKDQSGTTQEQGKQDSASNEAGVPPVDTVKAIFELGVTLLTASGQTERDSRSIVGRWRKNYSDSRVLEALVDCQNRRISNPVEWMPRRLSASGAQAPGSDLASLLEQSSRYRKQAA
jgi:hypothetical protein